MTKRTTALLCVILSLFTLLYLRIYFIGKDNTIAQVANQQGTYTLKADKIKGRIYDRNFEQLVNNNALPTYAIVPNAESMKFILDIIPQEETERIYDLFSTEKPFLYGGIGEGISIDSDSMTLLPTKKRYSDSQLAVHIIGHLDGDGKGVAGIEKAYDDVLDELSGNISITYDVDALSGVLWGTVPTINNDRYDNEQGVVLSLDRRIQTLVERVGSKSIEKGSILVMDCESGQIIASASFPKFNPNDVADSLNAQNAPLVNRSFSPYNIGSVFKLTVIAAALENGVSTDYTYECTGSIQVGDTVFHCLNRGGHGEIDMNKATQVSCNPYFVHLAMEEVGEARIREMAVNMGFGSPNELAPNFGAASGVIPTSEDLENPVEFGNFSFGQGKLTATPLQIAQSLSVFANGGYLVDPTVTLGISDQSGKNILKTEGNNQPIRVLDENVANTVKDLMENVVLEGSGRNANPDFGGAGGKTGSAQTGNYDELGEEIVHAWFGGFFPADHPRYTVVVLNEGADSGSLYSAPLFKEIADGINLLDEYNRPWYKQILLEQSKSEEESEQVGDGEGMEEIIE